MDGRCGRNSRSRRRLRSGQILRHQPHWAAFGTRSTRNQGSPGYAGPGFNGWEDISCVWVPVHSRQGTSSDHRDAGSAARRLRSPRALHEEVLETGLTSLLAPADTRGARLSFEWAEAQLPRMKMSLLGSTGLCFAASLLGRRCAARRSTGYPEVELEERCRLVLLHAVVVLHRVVFLHVVLLHLVFLGLLGLLVFLHFVFLHFVFLHLVVLHLVVVHLVLFHVVVLHAVLLHRVTRLCESGEGHCQETHCH